MAFAGRLSTDRSTSRALAEVVRAAESLGGPPDLAVCFYSPHHGASMRGIAEYLNLHLKPRCLIGCQGESIIGARREVEGEPAISLWLADWAGRVEAEPFHLTPDRTPDGPSLFGWPDALVEADPS